MTGLPEFFKQTSDKPYDRHLYQMIYFDGKKEVFDSWEAVQLKWFQTPSRFTNSIEVLDKKITTKGFK